MTSLRRKYLGENYLFPDSSMQQEISTARLISRYWGTSRSNGQSQQWLPLGGPDGVFITEGLRVVKDRCMFHFSFVMRSHAMRSRAMRLHVMRLHDYNVPS